MFCSLNNKLRAFRPSEVHKETISSLYAKLCIENLKKEKERKKKPVDKQTKHKH